MVVIVGSTVRKSPHTMYAIIGRGGGGGAGLNMKDRYLELAIFNHVYRERYPLLYTVYRILYPDIIKCIEGNICPFCHRQFSRHGSLRIHLTRSYNGCGSLFRETIKYAVKIHSRIPKRIGKKYYLNGKSYHKHEIHKLIKELSQTIF